MNSIEDDCPFCSSERTGPPIGEWVYQDDLWSVGMSEGFESPGWLVLQARRHVIGLAGLSRQEQMSMGVILHRLSRAIAGATGAEKVYVAAYGENHEHWHMVLMARAAAVPNEHRGPNLILNRKVYLDPDGATTAAEAIRSALATGHVDAAP
jgi:diadenosine tetraphosphate (Ap4A) HIT family hydrolase